MGLAWILCPPSPRGGGQERAQGSLELAGEGGLSPTMSVWYQIPNMREGLVLAATEHQ